MSYYTTLYIISYGTPFIEHWILDISSELIMQDVNMIDFSMWEHDFDISENFGVKIEFNHRLSMMMFVYCINMIRGFGMLIV